MESLSQKNSSGESDCVLVGKEKNFSFWNLWMIYISAVLFFLHGLLTSSGLDSVFIYFSDIFDEEPWFLNSIWGVTPTTTLATTLMILALVKGITSVKKRQKKHTFFYLSSVLILFIFASDISEYGDLVLWLQR
jgi:hypothetical protein